MLKLKIDSINGYEYLLSDTNKNSYYVNIEFYGLNDNLTLDDKIFIEEKLLNNINNQMVNFQVINYDFLSNVNKDEIMIIVRNNGDKIYLYRVYG